jgi:hypothetical protein
VQFPDFIRQEIANCKVLIALIGDQWATRIRDANDSVRMEIETAFANQIPVLPVLIGNTPMPDVNALPTSISAVASQNAVTVGVSLDFHTHMQLLLPKIESILGALTATSIGATDPHLIDRASNGVIDYLRARAQLEPELASWVQWDVIGVDGLRNPPRAGVTLHLHRMRRLAELIELHFILSFWGGDPKTEQFIAGWVFRQLEQSPFVPDEYLSAGNWAPEFNLKIRWSDEDPRQVWKMITSEPLRLSLAYVATVSPKSMSDLAPTVTATEVEGLELVSDASPPLVPKGSTD